MENEIALLIVSHGNFAQAALKSSELIVGDQSNVETIGIDVVDSLKEVEDEMDKKLQKLNKEKGLLVIGDLFGGSPLNLSMSLLDKENVMIVSGLSLPILLEVFTNRNKKLNDLRKIIKHTHNNALVIKTHEDFKNEKEENNDIIL